MSHSTTVATGAGVGPDVDRALEAALASVIEGMEDEPADLTVLFLGAAYAAAADRVLGRVREALSPSVLVGVTAQGVVSDAGELEEPASLSLWAACLPGAQLTPMRFSAPGEADELPEWPGLPPGIRGLVLLADPFSFPVPALLAWAAQSRPGLPISGGVASGAGAAGEARLLLDDAVHTDGAVGVAIAGDVALRHLVSQGCRPVGPPFAITGAERNIIHELAGVPAATRIREVYDGAEPEDQARMRSGLHIGIVIDEYAEEHERGDFLVRGVIGAEPESGAVAVGDLVRVGQTVRFHVRDARSADEDLRALLDDMGEPAPVGALLFTCNGRGSGLFGTPDHDAGLLHLALGGAPVAGFFAAGEIGPVGPRSHLHGFTASTLIFDA